MGKIKVVNKSGIVPKHKAEHKKYEYYKYQALGREDHCRCTVCIYEIPPGKSNYPYHYHTNNEEIFYIISGTGVLDLPDGSREVSAGDFIICPVGEESAHRLTNISETEMLIYLDCDTANYPDVVFYPETGKVGILSNGEARFYRTNDDVDYYEGE